MIRQSFVLIAFNWLVLLSGTSNANCWADFERPEPQQVGWVKVYPASDPDHARVSAYWAMAGPTDQMDYITFAVELASSIDSSEFSDLPRNFPVIADVEIREGQKWLIIREIVLNKATFSSAAANRDPKWGSPCSSHFADW